MVKRNRDIASPRHYSKSSLACIFTMLAISQKNFEIKAFTVDIQIETTRMQSQYRVAATNAEEMPGDDTLDNVKRIFCISDLHMDSSGNVEWLENKCSMNIKNSLPGKDDLLVVAGDISHKLDIIQKTLEMLQGLGCHLWFVPGNHEAWVNYKGGFDYWPWTDFVKCEWTDIFPLIDRHEENGRIPKGLVEHFAKNNKASIDKVRNSLIAPSSNQGSGDVNTGVMTVSHFLPNAQCLPDWKDLNSPVFLREWLNHGVPEIAAKFAKVAGSSLLDTQLRSLVPQGGEERQIHVFGHSHRPKDFDFQGIRYVHNPLGKPRERSMHMVDPNVDFQLLWDTRTGEVDGKRIIRYWEQYGGGIEALRERMLKSRPKLAKRLAKKGRAL